MHSIRISGTISLHIGPSQIQMMRLRHQRKKDQERPLHDRYQFDSVEVQFASSRRPFFCERR